MFELCVGFDNGTARVVQGIVFLTGAKVGDAAGEFLRVVTSGEGAFRVSPVVFRLAQLPRLNWR